MRAATARRTILAMATGLHVQVKKSFSSLLKTARVRAGYASAAKFATAIDVEAPTYRHWERGHALPDMTNLIRICLMLDLSLDDTLMAAVKKSPGKPKHLHAVGSGSR